MTKVGIELLGQLKIEIPKCFQNSNFGKILNFG